MRLTLLSLFLGLLASSSAAGQAPKRASRIKQIVAKALDSAVTSSAASLVDSALGTTGGVAGGTGCPAGTVPVAAGSGLVGVAPGAAVPSAGAAIIGAARKKLAKAKAEPATAVAAAPQVSCVAPAQLQAAQQAAAAGQPGAVGGAPQAPGMGGAAKGLLAATPMGAMAMGAVAAAPMAGKAAKAIGGMLGGKGPSKENMIKDLAKGYLVLKGIRFIEGSDVLADGFEDDLATLAEALGALGGEFVLNLPAEARDKAEPDTALARRRLTKLAAHLSVAGIGPDHVVSSGIFPPGLDSKKKAPKWGDARPEIVKKGAAQ